MLQETKYKCGTFQTVRRSKKLTGVGILTMLSIFTLQVIVNTIRVYLEQDQQERIHKWDCIKRLKMISTIKCVVWVAYLKDVIHWTLHTKRVSSLLLQLITDCTFTTTVRNELIKLWWCSLWIIYFLINLTFLINANIFLKLF